MKQQDVAIIIAVIFFAGIFSYFTSNLLFPGAKSNQTVEVVSSISSQFISPSSKYFNPSSIDPTQLIQITNNSNKAPFGTGSN